MAEVTVTVSDVVASLVLDMLKSPAVRNYIATHTYATAAFYQDGGIVPALEAALKEMGHG